MKIPTIEFPTRKPRDFGTVPGRFLLGLLACQITCTAGPLIQGVSTDAAAYAPGSRVVLTVDLVNSTAGAFDGALTSTIYHLGRRVATVAPAGGTKLEPGARSTLTFEWTAPAVDYRGYLVTVVARDAAGVEVDRGGSAVDVSSDWSKFPRYGYLAHFGPEVDADAVVRQLKDYHINGLQFYDWQWKHHVPYSPEETWPDIANRPISRATVNRLVAAAHRYRMMAMNYNLYGGAFDRYTTDPSGAKLSMGIFTAAKPASGYTLADQAKYTLPASWATRDLFQMNNRDPEWQQFIFRQEREVFANFTFDGWHIDSLGTRSAYDYAGQQFSLLDHHPEFVNNAKAALRKRMVFNTVDAAGEGQIAQRADVDFVYSELWTDNPSYAHIALRADNVRAHGNKALVLAAYMNRGLGSGFFNEASVRLANAAIFASGASHIELGDGDKMLRTEYFPNHNVAMSDSLRSSMRAYYDFLVGYENLLRDETVSDQRRVTLEGVRTSGDGAPGTVWVLTKRNLGHNIAHFVNLVNNTSSEWRDEHATYKAPPVLTEIPVKMYHSGPIGSGKLWTATPDADGGQARELSFETGSDSGGTHVRFTLPRLEYWTMVWLEQTGARKADAVLHGAEADTFAGVTLEPTSAAAGSLNVGAVKNTTGASYIGFKHVDFGAGSLKVAAVVATPLDGAKIEMRVDRPDGDLIATLEVPNTGGWQTWRSVAAATARISGVRPVFAVFKGVASNLFSLQFDLSSGPEFTLQPASQSIAPGGTAVFQAAAKGSVSYQWLKDGIAIAGATGPTLTIANASVAHNGIYRAIATDATGSSTSESAMLFVGALRPLGMINLSTRGYVGRGADMIAGFVLGGSGAKSVLVRASGPALIGLGVTGSLQDPVVEVRDGSRRVAANDDWSSDPESRTTVAAAARAAGAFPWTDGSKDAALVLTLPPGAYSAIASGKDGGTGVALVEVYELDPANAGARLINLSTRAVVNPGSEKLIVGFVIAGAAPKRVLVRATGPALERFGVTGALSDPAIEVFAGDAAIAANDDWPAALAGEFAQVGAFPWNPGSRDAAAILNLEPGAYTAVVGGKNGAGGTALIEIYACN